MIPCTTLLSSILAIHALTQCSPGSAQPDYNLHKVRKMLFGVAQKLEIVGKYERTNFFVSDIDLIDDIKVMVNRYLKVRHYPAVGFCQAFPDDDVLYSLIQINREYYRFIVQAQIESPGRFFFFEKVKRQCEELYHVYDLARDARRETCSDHSRRCSLHELERIIGSEAFYAGSLPPPIPWR